MIVKKTFRFEASHVLPNHPGKCSRLHGHSWVLTVEVFGGIDKHTGFVMDFAEISKTVSPLIDDLDHRHLGAWEAVGTQKNWKVPALPFLFYPSSENLLVWIGAQLANAGLAWSALELNETCTSCARLERAEFDMGRE